MVWSGVLGFIKAPVETTPGVFLEGVDEVRYTGQILRESRGASEGHSSQNKTPYVRMAISVVPDKRLIQNISSVRYATYMNVKWSVTSFEIQQANKYILNLGDVYDH
jgi:hypothetical protein